MEASLHGRLEGVDTISISQSRQTAEVTFTPGDHAFSLPDFRDAIRQADVEVLTVDLEACGIVEQSTDERWLVAGTNRFMLVGSDTAAPGQIVCVSGQLDDQSGRHRLTVTAIEAAGG